MFWNAFALMTVNFRLSDKKYGNVPPRETRSSMPLIWFCTAIWNVRRNSLKVSIELSNGLSWTQSSKALSWMPQEAWERVWARFRRAGNWVICVFSSCSLLWGGAQTGLSKRNVNVNERNILTDLWPMLRLTNMNITTNNWRLIHDKDWETKNGCLTKRGLI